MRVFLDRQKMSCWTRYTLSFTGGWRSWYAKSWGPEDETDPAEYAVSRSWGMGTVWSNESGREFA